MPGQNVLSDAQMGMFQVIRPPSNFESVYQGQDGAIPIAFPGVLDPLAGTPGYGSDLLAGIPVPLGGRLCLQIPMTISDDGEDDFIVVAAYEYQLIWRTRNQSSVRASIQAGRPASAFHLPNEEPGRGQLVFIPGCSDVEVFEQDEASSGASILDVVQQRYRPKITVPWVRPLLGNGNSGVWQQGVFNTQQANPAVGPSWAPLWTDALGDELLILAYKIDTGVPWDFTDPDVDGAFSNTYGTNNGVFPQAQPVGILLSSGTMGS